MSKCYNPIMIKVKNREDYKMIVDCGKCINCKQKKKREVAMRMVHESTNKKNAYFITLTYKTGEAPIINKRLSISKEDARNYIKRIREQLRREKINEDGSFKYIFAGEYGGETNRPHYHMVATSNKEIAHILKKKWKKGEVNIQKVISVASIYYTAGYTEKKVGTQIKKDTENSFHKMSQGNGRDWLFKNRDRFRNENQQFLRTGKGIIALPMYYKNKLLKWRIHDEEMKERQREKIMRIKYKEINRAIAYALERIEIKAMNRNFDEHMKKCDDIIWKSWKRQRYLRAKLEQERRNKLKEEAIAKLWKRREKRNAI